MALRFRTGIALAFAILVTYFVFWRHSLSLNYGQHSVDVFHEALGDVGTGPESWEESPEHLEIPLDGVSLPPATKESQSTTPIEPDLEVAAIPLQKQFETEYEALGLEQKAGAVYGTTLNHLIEAGGHAGFASQALSPTNSTPSENKTPLYKYSPYPKYNSKMWDKVNTGQYIACDGHWGQIEDVLVASGHPPIFGKPLVGSYVPLDIDSNLCFERETRLGHYGFAQSQITNKAGDEVTDQAVWDSINWGSLQTNCLERNLGRYTAQNSLAKFYLKEDPREHGLNSTAHTNQTSKYRRLDADLDEEEARKKGLHGMPQDSVKQVPKSRSAVLIRTDSNQIYTENDKQNIRSIITELSLRSGGEYQVWLVVDVKDPEIAIPINIDVHNSTGLSFVPEEFQDMVILWNEASIKEWYPLLPEKAIDDDSNHWLVVQKFSQVHPEFNFVWNWEFDTRYTGQHYNLLDKLSKFASNQPRKGLWERNARFFIHTIHRHYDTIFRRTVEKLYDGTSTIWGPASHPNVTLLGPAKPVPEPIEDQYKWGVGEEADYISLSPIFDPKHTTRSQSEEVWGYAGEDMPRRASVGSHSRVSKRLLEAMHQEDLKGNHLSNELAPATTALLHGFKPVFAPMPVFFDRDWTAESINKYLNPGPLGESGSSENSPFSKEFEASRFEGTTWSANSSPPTRMYNNWLGLEENGKGGPEWEKAHGRVCLPPMLLRPIKATPTAQSPGPLLSSATE